jgi:hypothetical protein
VTGWRCPGRSMAPAAFVLPLSAMALEAFWTRPVTPQSCVGNLYDVGSEQHASFFIVPSQGDIGINCMKTENEPMFMRNVEALGF